ncbi:hypothetical protein [Lactococcus petauri]|uniref:hypothetical protein n=1 Tax=Lactococcus petauri TaxID=1940789 RepID=UPI003854BF2F
MKFILTGPSFINSSNKEVYSSAVAKADSILDMMERLKQQDYWVINIVDDFAFKVIDVRPVYEKEVVN